MICAHVLVALGSGPFWPSGWAFCAGQTPHISHKLYGVRWNVHNNAGVAVDAAPLDRTGLRKKSNRSLTAQFSVFIMIWTLLETKLQHAQSFATEPESPRQVGGPAVCLRHRRLVVVPRARRDSSEGFSHRY